jgi:hypothetical protein
LILIAHIAATIAVGGGGGVGGKVEVMNLYSLQPKGGLHIKGAAFNICIQHPPHFFRLCVQVANSIQFYEILGYVAHLLVASLLSISSEQ